MCKINIKILIPVFMERNAIMEPHGETVPKYLIYLTNTEKFLAGTMLSQSCYLNSILHRNPPKMKLLGIKYIYKLKKKKHYFMKSQLNDIDFFLIDNIYLKLKLHNISGLFCKK